MYKNMWIIAPITPQIHFSAPHIFSLDMTYHMSRICANLDDVRGQVTMIICATTMLCTIVSLISQKCDLFVLMYCIGPCLDDLCSSIPFVVGHGLSS
jgi:hypothetical protein